MGRYTSPGALSDYLSADVAQQTLDDNNDGTPDPASVARCIADAENLVDAYIRRAYVLPLVAPIDPILETISLMAASAFVAMRHAEYVRFDWKERMKAATDLLKEIRDGDVQLGNLLLDGTGIPDVYSDEPARPVRRELHLQTMNLFLDGIDELEIALTGASAGLDRDLDDSSFEAAKDGVEAAQQDHPYTDRTQDLTNTAHPERVAGGEADMVWPAPYAVFVDKGTTRSRAYPFTPIASRAADEGLTKEGTKALDSFTRKVGSG